MIIPVAPCSADPAGRGKLPAVQSMKRQQYPGPLEVIVASALLPPDNPAPAAGYPAAAEPDASGGPPASATDKVRNLWTGVKRARHRILVFCDADVEVPSTLLRELVQALSQPEAGLSYALPCWTGARSGGPLLLQAWANAQVGAFLLPIARYARRRPVTGALVVIPRQVLEEIGGVAALAGYLADDARLGDLVQTAGYRAIPCGWVRVASGNRGWGEALSTFLRWLLTLRHHTPLAYTLSYLTHWVTAGLIWGLWMQARGANPLCAWVPLVAAAVARVWSASLPARYARAPDPWVAVLAPLADLVAAVLWPAPLLVRRVTWAGTTFRVLGGGRVLPVRAPGDTGTSHATKRNSPAGRQ